MACPFFFPRSPVSALSRLYEGDCAAGTQAPVPTDFLECCNHGYARDKCPQAAQSDADALRFIVRSHADGVVEVAWSSERNHHPVAVGVLAIGREFAAVSPLEHQALACAAQYLRHVS